jgi:hypothetical protein
MVLSFRFYVLGARGASACVARGMLSICVRAFRVIKLFCYAKFFLFRSSNFTSCMMNVVQLRIAEVHRIWN